MNVDGGFAMRRDSFGAGFEYQHPKGAGRAKLCYFEDRAERMLEIWVHEAYLRALDRSGPGQAPVVTPHDIDEALQTVVKVMRRTRRPLLGHLTRTVGQLQYLAPESDSAIVVRHFECEAPRFVNDWAAEIELAAYNRSDGGRVSVTRDVIDRALVAAVNRLAERRKQAAVEVKPARPAWWRRAGRFARAWLTAILTALGGAGGTWALITVLLQGAGLFTVLPISLAVGGLGLFVVVAAGRRR